MTDCWIWLECKHVMYPNLLCSFSDDMASSKNPKSGLHGITESHSFSLFKSNISYKETVVTRFKKKSLVIHLTKPTVTVLYQVTQLPVKVYFLVWSFFLLISILMKLWNIQMYFRGKCQMENELPFPREERDRRKRIMQLSLFLQPLCETHAVRGEVQQVGSIW